MRIHPPSQSKRYVDWLSEIRPWCISRQLWWGHQIPVWYRGDEVYCGVEPPEGEGWEQDPDVLDTWFSSALWPFATLGWPEQTDELRAFYPTDVLSTGRDILFLWVARMVMMGLRFTGEIPFSDVNVHSIIQAPDGRRMSKSLGTGVDPLHLVEGGPRPPSFPQGGDFPAYGADAVRFGLLAMSSTQDVRFSEEKIQQGQALANKLYNATRFVALRVGDGVRPAAEPEAVEDRWILSRLQAIKADTQARIDAFDFAKAALGLYDFVYGELCDWYLELVKPRLGEDADPGERAALGATLLHVLRETIATAHPIIPFVTEELWELLGYTKAEGLLAAGRLPKPDDTLRDPAAEEAMGRAIEAIQGLRTWRDSVGVKAGAIVPGVLRATGYEETAARVAGLARFDLRSDDNGSEPVATIAIPGGAVAVLASEAVDLGAADRKLAQQRETLAAEIERAAKKLSNEGFVAKAPAAVVAAERDKLERLRAELDRPAGSGRMSASTPAPPASWTATDAERWLLSIELFGMRFGLDRMHKLMDALGRPNEAFRAIHVVGTNGKSSTTRMIAALLTHHGVRTGAYLSPHLVTFAERIRVDGADVSSEQFAAAAGLAHAATQFVDGELDPDDGVTQFEALTASAYVQLARSEVQAAVVEAGLGGRWDATNVIGAEIAVLTNIGLEHTRWLGSTVAEIAREKLAVLAPGATLVLGADLHPDADTEARLHAERQGATILRAPREAVFPGSARDVASTRARRRGGARRRQPARRRHRRPRARAARAARARRLPAAQLRRRLHGGAGVPRLPRRGGRARGGGVDGGPRPLRGRHRHRRRRDPARRRPQRRRHRGARRVAARLPRRPAARRGRVGARRQGRARDARRPARAVLRGRLHGERQPARHRARAARRARGRPSARRRERGRGRSAPRAGRRARARRDRRRRARHRLDLPRRRPQAPARRRPRLDAVSEKGPSAFALIAAVAIIVALVILVFFAIGYGIGRMVL